MKCLIFIVISVGIVLTADLQKSEDELHRILKTLITKTDKETQQKILAASDYLATYDNDGGNAEKLGNRSDDSASDSESSDEDIRRKKKLNGQQLENRSDDSASDSESSDEDIRRKKKLNGQQLENRSDDSASDSESSDEDIRRKKNLNDEQLENRSDESASDSESSEEDFRKNEIHRRIQADSNYLDIKENDFMPKGLKELIAEKLNDRSDDSADDSESSEEDVRGNERIFGGQIAPRNAYPHQVALSLMFVTGVSSWCGGSIISDSYILTAAHCLDNVVAATVMMGAYDRLNSGESGRVTQTVRSGNFIVHRGWQSSLMRNDIALIRLNNKIQFTNAIQPISLPSQFDTAEGKQGIISGWGHYDNSKKLSRYLRHAQSRIIDLSYCSQYFSQYITQNNVCLDGSGGQGTCHGDSGGPLIVQSPTGKAVLIGLTSFGSGTGCDMGWPTVFTRISSYLSWIQQNTRI